MYVRLHRPPVPPRLLTRPFALAAAVARAFLLVLAMPRSAPKKCSFVGCRKLVSDGSGRCEDHARPAWVKRKEVTKRITGRRLQKMREDLFMREPLCAECKQAGRVTLATQRDHIIPLFEGGPDDETNEQGLCVPCHETKSLAEAQRGRYPSR